LSAARRLLVAALLATSAALALAPAAFAEYGAPQLISRTAAQQAVSASSPAISADGRFVAFQGEIGDRIGVFREEVATGAIVPVATGSISAAQTQFYLTAAPSISADGRYVSFTTTARLDPTDDLGANSPDVYVADMATSPPTYELASALDGCEPEASATPCGLTYSGSGGAKAAGRVALSASGRKVAFVTTAPSNLTSEPTGSTPGTTTPAGQVVVRDLATDTTTLVSAERSSLSDEMTEDPVPGGGVVNLPNLPLLAGAAISADGSTVAWVGAHLAAQVSMGAAEAQKLETTHLTYDEPLWRRLTAGAPTRRMVAGDGTEPYPPQTNKNENNNSAEGWIGQPGADGVPSLSADGDIAFLLGNPTEATNLFEVNMAPGLTRGQAVRQLTMQAGFNPLDPHHSVNSGKSVALDGAVFDTSLSPDGERVAFVTARQRFPLASPVLVGSPPVTVGLVELYVLNLETDSFERVTHGLGGVSEASENAQSRKQTEPGSIAGNGSGATSPSFGGEGLLAFASNADNLAAGDGNEASDVFLERNSEATLTPGATSISEGPTEKKTKKAPWRLTLTARSLPHGQVRLIAQVPAKGRLRAEVKPEPDGPVNAGHLGSARARSLKGGRVAVVLRLPKRLRRLAHTREGVYAFAKVSFHAKGRRVLRGTVQMRFHVHAVKKSSGK
jgi:hypothetical protein